ncbi:hypothetical protein BZG01_12685 [Labilibaculum manganireducens]|uniref:DUF5640 domain-containing protein n=1 Tax=Labilibaculum manganireducens TaxID=1940525 RepID=A0A2N3I6U1_9BACT|nr:hypothetical protein [Labilibaculum manganireducens]PKQ66007.1 hypothetical protein BZG01_12685 [Labilibaculum manganireducens]
MKKARIILFGMLFGLIAISANAQASDFFVGKWAILVTGIPNGDATSYFTFERVDGKITGFTKTEGAAAIKFSRVEEDGDEVTAYFTSASGYDVYLYIEKIDENHVEGSMMDMFDCTGERVVEDKKE